MTPGDGLKPLIHVPREPSVEYKHGHGHGHGHGQQHQQQEVPYRYPLGFSRTFWAHAALWFVSFTFSGMNVMVQQALPSSSVGSSIIFSFLRDAIASPLLTIAMVLTKSYCRPRRADLFKLLIVMGMVGMSGNQTFFVLGLDYVGGDVAAVYNCIGPSIMFIMSLSLGLEQFSLLKVVGVLLGAGGVVLISELWDVDFSRKNVLLGHLFLFLGIVASQLFTIIQKYLKGYPPLMMTAVAYWAALCTISVPAVIVSVTDHSGDLWPTSMFQWGTVMYAGVISSGLNYYLLVFATSHLPPLSVSIYGVVQPLVTDLFNYVFVGKGLSQWDIYGSFCIILSVLVTTYSQAQLDEAQKHHFEQLDKISDGGDHDTCETDVDEAWCPKAKMNHAACDSANP